MESEPTGPRRIYLDNAATSFPKAPGVAEAVGEYLTRIGASPGRGGYAESRAGSAILASCRERLCRLVNGTSPDHVVFTLNCSDALNLALKGVVTHRRRANPRARVHIITTQMDHNSVLRPLNEMIQDGVNWTCVDADPKSGLVDPDAISRAIRDETALVAVCHASNVSGTLQDLAPIARVCHARGVPILADAAQSLGHVPIDVRALAIDLLAFPGHKGLLGPLGTGGLYLRPGMEDVVATIREGGTGTQSEDDVQPLTMPDRYEPGSHNMPGIAGLNASLAWILDQGVESIQQHEQRLVGTFVARLEDLARAGFSLLAPDAPRRVAVFSIVHERLGARDVANRLESGFGVLARAGFHCAPRAHRALASPAGEGALRLSASIFTSERDIDLAIDALLEIALRDDPPTIRTLTPASDRPTARR